MSAAQAKKTWPQRLVDLLASYGLACVLLLFLFLLTLLGTLEQVNMGLFEVQAKYFDSLFLIHWIDGVIPVPLPGVSLLLGLLAVNLVLGGVVRIRRSRETAGVIVAHLGILFMIAAGLVTYLASTNGSLALHPGETGTYYTSYYDWELAVSPAEAGTVTESKVPEAWFRGATPAAPRVFTSSELPFELHVTSWMKNCEPVQGDEQEAQGQQVVDGFALHPLELEKQAEKNQRGITISVVGQDGKTLQGLLWGGSQHPWVFDMGGHSWALELRRLRYPLPFQVRLDEFIKSEHPGTSMARSFESKVTKLEQGQEDKVHIRMNQPLRSEGYTLFQAEWGMDRDGVYSVFAVVKNPADRWPEYSCYIIALGLLFHFGLKLLRYIRSQQAKRGAA